MEILFLLVLSAMLSFPLHPLAVSTQVGSQPSNSRPLQSTIAHRGKNCPNHGQDVAWQEVGGELDHVGATFDVGQSWSCRCKPQSIRRIFASEQVISELSDDGLRPFLYFLFCFRHFTAASPDPQPDLECQVKLMICFNMDLTK